jgi:hypothetical protein
MEAGTMVKKETSVVLVGRKVVKLPFSSMLQKEFVLEGMHKDEVEHAIFPGAVTDSVLRKTMEYKKLKTVVVPDATHLFISTSLLHRFNKQGKKIQVLYPIHIVGVAINPTSPDGYVLDPVEMTQCVKKYCPNTPVFDVVKGGL